MEIKTKRRIKPFFHLQDPVSLQAMSDAMTIACCREQHCNAPNHVEIHEKELIGGRLVNKVPRNDSYCRVRERGWQYGPPGDKGPYKGDAWSVKEDEFMSQSDDRRCPLCEAIWKNKSLDVIFASRAATKFGI